MTAIGPDEFHKRLDRALAIAGGTHTAEDIAEAVEQGRMQSWVNDDSFVVTEVLQFPQTKALNVFLAVGDLTKVMALQPDIEAFGRKHGCKVMRMEGRKGWHRVLPHYGWKQDQKVIYERTL